MLVERLDKEQMTVVQAVNHIEQQIRNDILNNPGRIEALSPINFGWMSGRGNVDFAIQESAWNDILIALRDGDLVAQGRLSTERTPWNSLGGGWVMHSGHHSRIAPEQWSGGQWDRNYGMLTMLDGQFIDIMVPRFAVLAIWPPIHITSNMPSILLPPPVPALAPVSYHTTYMDLIVRAIGEFSITEKNQPKKDNLVDWFKAQSVNGEPVSDNLANAMATLVRMPESQRGGARRGISL